MKTKFQTYDFKNDVLLDGICWHVVCTREVWLYDPILVLNTTWQGFRVFRRWTGMVDKLGVGIYEGDYLWCDWEDSRYPAHTIGPVEWDTYDIQWVLGEGANNSYDAENFMEVRGSIYDEIKDRKDFTWLTGASNG